MRMIVLYIKKVFIVAIVGSCLYFYAVSCDSLGAISVLLEKILHLLETIPSCTSFGSNLEKFKALSGVSQHDFVQPSMR